LGNRKVGYLVFKGFIQPSFKELDEAVEFFNAEGIDDLILDLRYNGGGQTSVANYLASMIGGEGLAGQPFAKYLYNENQAADENFTDNLKLVEPNLGLDRLITIATRATASASEMVINGLTPFMPVFIVGSNTYGKPMGMNAWYSNDNQYAYVPVTFKIANANDEGDYFLGLPADSNVADDLTRAFGDPEEGMLKEALRFIETGTFSGGFATKSLVLQPFEQMTGLRAEIGAH
jgi:carboxyl-terminal processing protease